MPLKPFNDYDYTREAILKQLVLIELHGKDGSAVNAGCQCINTKHTYMLEGLAEEMVGFAKTEKEKEFYLIVSDLMRGLRKKIDSEDWNIHGLMRGVMKTKYPTPRVVVTNPHGRLYLPYHLTACEKANPDVLKKMSACIRQVEEKSGEEAYVSINPVAVCRAKIKCPA